MWEYKKILEFPVNITKPNLKFASLLISAIGGYTGELNASIRYFMQAPTMPDLVGRNLLMEIATEEMAHVEILFAMMEGLTKNQTAADYQAQGVSSMFIEHGKGIYPSDSFGNAYTADYFASTGDVLTDLSEDMTAEQKARAGYEHLMSMTNDPEILGPLSFLREREIIHYQRFAEALKYYQEKLGKEY